MPYPHHLQQESTRTIEIDKQKELPCKDPISIEEQLGNSSIAVSSYPLITPRLGPPLNQKNATVEENSVSGETEDEYLFMGANSKRNIVTKLAAMD